MLIPIRQIVPLAHGAVTLRAWPATVADAHLLDLLTLTVTLGQVRDEWHTFQRHDVDSGVWGSFWRLVQASLEDGCTLPKPLTWTDRVNLLDAMWELNDVEVTAGKLKALNLRAATLARRIQGQMTPPLMN